MTPQFLMPFHQQAADELGGDDLGGAGEEGRGEVLGGRGDYFSYNVVNNTTADALEQSFNTTLSEI